MRAILLIAIDTKPGQTDGQDLRGFGAAWYALGPTGAKIESGS